MCVHSVPHAVKGESIYAYVTVLDEVAPSAKLHAELVNLVKTQIGSFAAPDVIHWAPGDFVFWATLYSLSCTQHSFMHQLFRHAVLLEEFSDSWRQANRQWCSHALCHVVEYVCKT